MFLLKEASILIRFSFALHHSMIFSKWYLKFRLGSNVIPRMTGLRLWTTFISLILILSVDFGWKSLLLPLRANNVYVVFLKCTSRPSCEHSLLNAVVTFWILACTDALFQCVHQMTTSSAIFLQKLYCYLTNCDKK